MPEELDFQKLVENAMANAGVPKIYANGFVSILGNGDVCIVFQQNGTTAGVLNLSFTMAKSLSNKLGEVVRYLEKGSDNIIMTTEDVDKALKRKVKEKNSEKGRA